MDPKHRKNLARKYIIATLRAAYEKPDFVSKGRVLEVTLTQYMQKSGFTISETLSALMYLEKVGRIDSESEIRENVIAGRSIKHTWKYYSLSEASLDDIEGQTEYSRKKEAHTVIYNRDGNLVIGDGNIVGSYNTYEAVFNDLDSAVNNAPDLSKEQKQDASADIATLKAQLRKPKPSIQILRAAWNSLSLLAAIEDVAQFYNRAKDIIEPLIN